MVDPPCLGQEQGLVNVVDGVEVPLLCAENTETNRDRNQVVHFVCIGRVGRRREGRRGRDSKGGRDRRGGGTGSSGSHGDGGIGSGNLAHGVQRDVLENVGRLETFYIPDNCGIINRQALQSNCVLNLSDGI